MLPWWFYALLKLVLNKVCANLLVSPSASGPFDRKMLLGQQRPYDAPTSRHPAAWLSAVTLQQTSPKTAVLYSACYNTNTAGHALPPRALESWKLQLSVAAGPCNQIFWALLWTRSCDCRELWQNLEIDGNGIRCQHGTNGSQPNFLINLWWLTLSLDLNPTFTNWVEIEIGNLWKPLVDVQTLLWYATCKPLQETKSTMNHPSCQTVCISLYPVLGSYPTIFNQWIAVNTMDPGCTCISFQVTHLPVAVMGGAALYILHAKR